MCKCLEKIEAKTQKHLQEELRAKGSAVAQISKDSGFESKVLSMSKGYVFAFRYLLIFKVNSLAKSFRKKSVYVFPSFCPFCGKKIVNKKEGKPVAGK